MVRPKWAPTPKPSCRVVETSGLVLASASPRRQQLLTDAGIDFDVAAPNIDEVAVGDGLPPIDYVRAVAAAKADATRGERVLAADTIVVHQGRILGKPENRNRARAMVLSMSDSTAQVVSAVVYRNGGDVRTETVTTVLTLRGLSPAEVHDYVKTGAADDKAGALSVQDGAAQFVTNIDGCQTNVFGLPMCKVHELLGLNTADCCNESPEKKERGV